MRLPTVKTFTKYYVLYATGQKGKVMVWPVRSTAKPTNFDQRKKSNPKAMEAIFLGKSTGKGSNWRSITNINTGEQTMGNYLIYQKHSRNEKRY